MIQQNVVQCTLIVFNDCLLSYSWVEQLNTVNHTIRKTTIFMNEGTWIMSMQFLKSLGKYSESRKHEYLESSSDACLNSHSRTRSYRWSFVQRDQVVARLVKWHKLWRHVIRGECTGALVLRSSKNIAKSLFLLILWRHGVNEREQSRIPEKRKWFLHSKKRVSHTNRDPK